MEEITALDVAMYTINKGIKERKPTDTIRLQKELFYIQKLYFQEINSFLFESEFVRWREGAVIENIKKKYMHHTGSGITTKQNSYSKIAFGVPGKIMEVKEITFSEDIFTELEKVIIDKVITSLRRYSSWELVDINNKELDEVNIGRKEVIDFKLLKKEK